MSDNGNTSLIEAIDIPTKSSECRRLSYDILIASVCIALLYILCIINFISGDFIDEFFSMYPHDVHRFWTVFTCTFVHDDIHHLNSYVVLFLITSVTVLNSSGRVPFFCISAIIIVIGNTISWIFGRSRMNGISALSFGLLSYIYISLLIDMGFPIQCSTRFIRPLCIAIFITVIYFILYSLHIVATLTASWEYNISGIIGCIVAVYIVHVPRISRWIGLLNVKQKEDSTQEESPPEHRVVVGKKLIKFGDLRKSIVYSFLLQTLQNY